MEKVKEGDNVPNFCCPGFGWEVCLIFSDNHNDSYDSIWGRCENPDCPKFQANIGSDDIYRGVSVAMREDLNEWREEQANAVMEATVKVNWNS